MAVADLFSFDIGAALGIDAEDEARELEDTEDATGLEGKTIAVNTRYGHRLQSRKFASDKALEDALPWHWQENDCYHCLSYGDVDMFSYLKAILKQQPLLYVAVSTWVIGGGAQT